MIKKALYVMSAGAILGGCATYAPLGVVYNSGTTGVSANSSVKPVKTGTACVKSFVGLLALGDGSIAAAKAEGGISRVSTVDYDVFNVLGVYGQYCTVVRGE